MPKSTCLRIPKKQGESAIRLVSELNLSNLKFQITQKENWLLIPLTSVPSTDTLNKFKKKLETFQISVCEVTERKKRHFTHLDILTDKLPSSLLESVPKAIDFIGDIAVVEIPCNLSNYKKAIGEAILNAHKNICTVLAKSGAVKGLYRLRRLEHIAGAYKTATIYKEYGCKYHVDIAKVYFSPRLSNEHNRIASQIKNGATVIDLFAGVGPFAILIGKKDEKALVYAIDINPDALDLLKLNIAVNRVEQQVIPIIGDARLIVQEKLLGKADHVIMNLPGTALDFVDVACQAIKPAGGVMHYYCFVKHSNPIKIAKVELTKAINQNQRRLKRFLSVKIVREVAPYTWQIVLDAKIQ